MLHGLCMERARQPTISRDPSAAHPAARAPVAANALPAANAKALPDDLPAPGQDAAERRVMSRRELSATRAFAPLDVDQMAAKVPPLRWNLATLTMVLVTMLGGLAVMALPTVPIIVLLGAAVGISSVVPPIHARLALARSTLRTPGELILLGVPMLLFGLAVSMWVIQGLDLIVALAMRITLGAVAAVSLRSRPGLIVATQWTLWASLVLMQPGLLSVTALTFVGIVGFWIGRNEQAVLEHEELLRAAQERAQSRARDILSDYEDTGQGWFWETDRRSQLTYVSETVARLLGKSADSMIGRPLVQLFDLVQTDENSERTLMFHLSTRSAFKELAVRAAIPGDDRWWSISGRPVFDTFDNFVGFRGSGTDLTERKRSQEEVSRLANFDSLTGLANRHRMQQRLDSILAAFKVARRSCALLMLDLDKFKAVNDRLGHPAGDELLRQVAQRLRGILVSPAEIGRLGGDEFQVIIPDMDDRGHLGDLAKKIIQMLSQPYDLGGDRAVIGASVGIAISRYDGDSPQDLVKNADLALYASKGGGRGQYRFFASDLANAAQRQREIGEDLKAALANDHLDMSYQPIVRGGDNKVVAFEALLRWEHPQLGAISPATFVPIAEELNLTARLGEWSLRRACRDAASWPGEIPVTVNVTPQLFFSGLLVPAVEEALEASGLRANRLELEVSEGVFMGETSQVDKIFARLAKRGVRLSLDDFGKDYSSLAFLRRAPFEKIKIDQGFVRGCAQAHSSNAAIISAIVSLAKALDMETTAAGVEAMDELQTVLQQGVTYIQGFIYSRPVPQDVVIAKLEAGDFVYEPVGPAYHRAERRTVLLRIGVYHEDARYEATLRNLSRTGALIEGLLDVPVGTELVLDLGGGQLAVATVRRLQDATQGVQFETPLISDGANGLCTRHRVSPHQLAAAGLAKADGTSPVGLGKRRFIQVDINAASSRAA